jgi:glycosyltransferase involved in cell wall biosynthesis
MKNPKISIVTVVFNGVQYIEQTIKSVISQNYNNIEYIIIDGGSNDGTQEIIKKYESDLAYWVSEKDSGIYNAMNKGWKKATGDVIGILNADDYYLDGTLFKIAQMFDKFNADIVYGNLTKLRDIGDKTYFREEFPNLSNMERAMGVFHPSSFVLRKVYEELDGYNEKYQLSSDYDFVLRAYKANYKFEYINESLTVFRIGGVSNTNCSSYKEGYQILLENKSEYAPLMKKAINRCYFKKGYKKIIQSLVTIFGLQNILEKRLEKKWR